MDELVRRVSRGLTPAEAIADLEVQRGSRSLPSCRDWLVQQRKRWRRRPGGSRGAAAMSWAAKRGHSRHGDGEVLRAEQGREEANIHVEGRYIYVYIASIINFDSISTVFGDSIRDLHANQNDDFDDLSQSYHVTRRKTTKRKSITTLQRIAQITSTKAEN